MLNKFLIMCAVWTEDMRNEYLKQFSQFGHRLYQQKVVEENIFMESIAFVTPARGLMGQTREFHKIILSFVKEILPVV